MHDEDDPKEEGSILYSGIRPESAAGPADYALPPGNAALEGGTPERVPVTWTRRRFFAVFLGAVGSAWAGYAWGKAPAAARSSTLPLKRPGERLTQRDLLRIESARTWARAPLEQLREVAVPFLWVFHVVEPDAPLLAGLRRLCDFALLDQGEAGHEMAVLLLDTFEHTPAPPVFEEYRKRLQDAVWKGQLRRQRNR